MPRSSDQKPYRWLAQYYDVLFEPMRAPLNAARKHVLRPILPTVMTACDLACGTGTTALSLARRGVRMYAVDRSPDMRRLTREKAARARLDVRVLRGDLRAFRLPEPVDLVTCEFDAVNHVPRRSDLRLVARAVEQALRPGGYFLFDVNNALGFRRYWTGNFWLEQPGVVLVMRNGHAPGGARAWTDVEWFIRRGNTWRREHERVEEVCWTAAEIRAVFRRAGFTSLRAWDAAPFFKGDSVTAPGCRTVYLARKRCDN